MHSMGRKQGFSVLKYVSRVFIAFLKSANRKLFVAERNLKDKWNSFSNLVACVNRAVWRLGVPQAELCNGVSRSVGKCVRAHLFACPSRESGQQGWVITGSSRVAWDRIIECLGTQGSHTVPATMLCSSSHCDVTHCSLVKGRRCIEGTWYLHLRGQQQLTFLTARCRVSAWTRFSTRCFLCLLGFLISRSWRWRQYFSPKYSWSYTKMYGVTHFFYRTITLILYMSVTHCVNADSLSHTSVVVLKFCTFAMFVYFHLQMSTKKNS
jgi:hypothetical protein